MGGGAGGGCAAPAAAAELLPAGSVYINSLWQLEEEEGLAAQPPDQQGRHSPLRHQLKSLASAASAADGAHLIARSSSGRSGDLKMRAGNSWREELAKLAAASQANSPRIAAARPTGVTAPDAEQWLLGGFGSLFRRISEQLLPAVGAGSANAAAGKAPHAAATPAAAATTPAAGAADGVELQLVVPESSGTSVGQGAGTAAARAAADSPAHLIAAAPPAFLWEASPEVQHATENAAGDGSTAGRAAAPGGLLPTETLQQAEEQQQEQLPQSQHQQIVQQADQKQQQQADQQCQEVEEQADHQQQRQDDHAAQPTAPQPPQPCMLQAEPSALSSAPSDARYSPDDAPAETAPTTSGGSGGSWQRDREEGGVRRSLAHPIFELQPGEVVEQQQRRRQAAGTITGLRAALAARWRPDPEGSPAAKAWSVSPAHIQIDMVAAGSSDESQPPISSSAGLRPPAGGAPPPADEWQRQVMQRWEHFRVQQQLHAQQQHVQQPEVEQQAQQQAQQQPSSRERESPRFGLLLEKFEQLDLSRARRAVCTELKKERKEAAAAAPRRSLLGRVRRSLSLKADHSRKLRRALEQERVLLLCLGRLPYNPDQPLHWELWQAVCRAYEGLGAAMQQQQQLQASDASAAWQLLGFSVANPAAELGDTGVLSLLLLLLLAERAPQLAARLLSASQGISPERPGCDTARPGFPPAAAAVEAATWMLRTLRSDELAIEMLRLESAVAAAECFWLGSLSCFLEEWAQAGPQQQQQLPPPLRMRALLVLAEESVWLDIGAAVQRGEGTR